MAAPQIEEIQQSSALQTVLPQSVHLPTPTAWPIVLAFGIALMCAGLVTAAPISILGAILALTGSIGWFRAVLPYEQHDAVAIVHESVPVATTRREVSRLPISEQFVRAFLPLESYPFSAGIKGGVAGGIAMAVVAVAYGIVTYRSLWYSINLLAAVVYATPLDVTTSQMAAFHLPLLLVAIAIHLSSSLLVGLLYGAVLPMFPRRPILFGGLFAPFLWSGLLYSMLDYINPLLGRRINWPWFVASQIAFGIAAGIVVGRQEKVRTLQNFPFAFRAGIEAPGTIPEQNSDPEVRK